MAATSGGASDDESDLSSVLAYICRDSQVATRVKVVNDAVTKEFLDTGLTLLRKHLVDYRGPDFDLVERNSLFTSVARQQIIDYSQSNGGNLTAARFRHRWYRQGFYTEDLISYLFRLEPHLRQLDEVEKAADSLIGEVSLGELIRKLAAMHLRDLLSGQRDDLEVILETALPNHPRVQALTRAQYEQFRPRWARLFEKVATAYGLALRDGFTWLDVAMMFNNAVRGASMRVRVRGEVRLSNDEDVVAGTIFAIVLGLLDVGSIQELDRLHAPVPQAGAGLLE